MHQLMLFERYPTYSIFWPNLLKTKKINDLSVEELLIKYKGFEGELISVANVINIENIDTKIIEEIKNEYLEKRKNCNCILLHIFKNPAHIPQYLLSSLVKIGYDIGVCEEEKTIYSSIFNEILFGHFDKLISFQSKLNNNFLFPERAVAEEYVLIHDQMSAEGIPVEDYEPMTIYEIWEHQI